MVALRTLAILFFVVLEVIYLSLRPGRPGLMVEQKEELKCFNFWFNDLALLDVIALEMTRKTTQMGYA
jgi:hypothetical protein